MKKILLFIVIVVGILISGCTAPASTPTPTSTPLPTPVYKTFNQNIVDSVIPVGAGQYVSYQFSAPSQASISGDFTAFGGSGNDIIVIILDETSYVNWINKHQVQAYYNSGQMTTGSITANVPAGKYYLIYSNTFSTLTNKNVKTKVDVSYTTCVENCGTQ